MTVFLIDAYNLIHAVPAFEAALEKSLRAARDALIRACRTLAAARGDVREVILVFDGDSAFRDLPAESGRGLRTVYTETHEDADEWIVRYLHGAAERGRIIVVSNDNYVTNHARGCGAGVMNAAAFRKMLDGPKARARVRRRAEAGEDVPAEVLKDVTASYRRHLGLDEPE